MDLINFLFTFRSLVISLECQWTVFCKEIAHSVQQFWVKSCIWLLREDHFSHPCYFFKNQTSKTPVFRTKTYPSKLYIFHMFQLGYSTSWNKIKSWYTVLLSGSWQCNKHNAQSTSIQNNAITLRQILLGLTRSHLNASSAACHVFTLFQSHYVFAAVCNYYGDCVLQYHTQW